MDANEAMEMISRSIDADHSNNRVDLAIKAKKNLQMNAVNT